MPWNCLFVLRDCTLQSLYYKFEKYIEGSIDICNQTCVDKVVQGAQGK